MQQGRPSALVSNNVDHRIDQLKIQIALLEQQLESSKRDLRNLENQRRYQDE